MDPFIYHMPTKLLFGEISPEELAGYGKKAFIITGKSSRKNGSLEDIIAALQEVSVAYHVFDKTEENPSIENVAEAAKEAIAFGADFVIGIGGGSPMDAAKAVAVLLSNPEKTGDDLYGSDKLSHAPVLMVPTTAGTGSETTPFSILTIHQKETKGSMSQLVFAEKAFLNGRYMLDMPESVTMSTAVDAFAHLAEGYLTSKVTFISDRLAESGLEAFGQCIHSLREQRFDLELRNKLLLISAMAGMVITHTKTSLPHQMGYALTYHKNVPHGYACGVLMHAFFAFHQDRDRVMKIISLLGLDSLEDFAALMRDLNDCKVDVTKEEIEKYTDAIYANREKLKTHPFEVGREDILVIYEKSLPI